MASAPTWVVAANGLFVVACGIVSVRLLLLSRRTRGLAEFYLGAGFFCMVLAIPLMGISGLGSRSAIEVDLLSFSLGLGLMWLSITTQAAFTWTAFRPDEGWAEALVLAVGASEAVIVGGALHALGAADPDTPSFAAAAAWMLALRIPLGFVYAWTCFESGRQYSMARRRSAIGLGDAATANRFLLWSLNGLLGVVSIAVSAGLHLQNRGPFSDPRAAAALGIAGAVGAIVLYLSFMPPDWYLRRIVGAAQTETTEASGRQRAA